MPAASSASTSGWHEPSRPGSSELSSPDFAVVDGQAVEGGEDVLDHFDLRAVGRQRGAAGHFDPLPNVGGDAPRRIQVAADKDDAAVPAAAGRNSTCTSRPLQYPKPATAHGPASVRWCRKAVVKVLRYCWWIQGAGVGACPMRRSSG